MPFCGQFWCGFCSLYGLVNTPIRMCKKIINTLTKEEKIIIKLIDKIGDPKNKKKYLIKLSQSSKLVII